MSTGVFELAGHQWSLEATEARETLLGTADFFVPRTVFRALLSTMQRPATHMGKEFEISTPPFAGRIDFAVTQGYH